MSTAVNLLIFGLADGAILALAALGFVLIYKATAVINFAQGEFLLVGAYTFYTCFVIFQLPITVGILVGVVVAVLLGIVVERLILRPMIGQSHISIIMVTIGLSGLLNAIVQMFFGTGVRAQPAVLPSPPVSILGATIPGNRLLAILIAAIVLTVLTIFFQKSKHGIAMRSVADDEQAAMTVGISVRRVYAMSWALAAVSALIAGILLADITAVDLHIASFGLMVFPVVILGGLDSVPGTIIGGLTIGIVTQLVSGYLDPGLAEVIPYIILVLILLIRPYGIFGEKRIERV
ncbi:branched-chain amino acid ABC transporter permease [Sediminivirga luteola]|uniref:Branched-chain amino acid ABC transporter permease n=1 Tax=Sediminivirga luteola TaxID=1774748 RepID=A0A8J2TVH0_9MICO|nr:branched-chain amino acid ABC transporter permease [Sediminivirga luteola]MCI2265295.1 branched-chain amino acid ABC transporter permease [Sediminivirga luteola]GGA04569.1 branched-chain amino acid ABC transporter permease [Sediminivirga luteola]